jgi:nitrate/nitrite-specific signal transduction histidine kinase
VSDIRGPQLDERKRIARELHESTAQLLTDLELEVRRLREISGSDAQPMIDEFSRLVSEIGDQIRELGLD